MAGREHRLRRELRNAGFSREAVDAAWPSWWDESLLDEPSGEAELRFALSRRLGLSAKSLLGERVEFIWNDEAFFKRLSAKDEAQKAAITSFGVTLGRLLVQSAPGGPGLEGLTAEILRAAILKTQPLVAIGEILSLCWGLGVPVVQLNVFPLDAKSMHAMIIHHAGRHAVLLARSPRYPSQAAFTLAHEVGHAALGHLRDAPAIVDMEDPASQSGPDDQEEQADHFALELLTGSPEPDIRIDAKRFSGSELAKAVQEVGPRHRIDPGTLALCVGYQRQAWPAAMQALSILEPDPVDVGSHINQIAARQLVWDEMGSDSRDWVERVLGL